MQWLVLPFGDARNASLSGKFKGNGIPMLVATGPSDRAITKEARDMIAVHGTCLTKNRISSIGPNKFIINKVHEVVDKLLRINIFSGKGLKSKKFYSKVSESYPNTNHLG
ncbi:hypothetical protein WN943_020496 [Citrus x changshan-huyou]